MNFNTLKIFLLSIYLFPIVLYAQNFDESFLKSLPDEIRSDLLQRANDKEESEEAQYRRPSTYINKPSDLDSDDDTPNVFGYDIFSMMQSSLMPINEPNFDGSYILDFGDLLELQLIGQESSLTKLTVKRDGSVNIPDIGKVFVAGLTLNDAVDVIKNKIAISYIGVEAFLTLVNVRDIQVIVAGSVFNPGAYTLNGNSNIFHALSIAGGPSKDGSYRDIKLIRGGEAIDSIDLYDTFIFGKSIFNNRLRSGDVVFVETVSNLVSVFGAFKRPGIYELKSSEMLSRAIDFANGLTNKADLSDVKVISVSDGIIITNKINSLSEFKNFKSQDSDTIFVRKHTYRSVKINGAVRNPGTYLINQGDGIFDLVNRAGGYTNNAYPYGGVLESNVTKEINQMAIDELYKSFLDGFMLTGTAASNESDQSNASAIGLIQELKDTEPSGRVNAEFDLKILEEDRSKDVLLQNGDEILIPEFLNQVYVFGEVSSEGTISFMGKQNSNYYINMKGGFNEYADKKNVFVLHPNGDTYKLGQKNKFLTPRDNQEIYPGSIIFVPRKTSNSYLATQTIQAYAAILGNIGVSLASVSVLKD